MSCLLDVERPALDRPVPTCAGRAQGTGRSARATACDTATPGCVPNADSGRTSDQSGRAHSPASVIGRSGREGDSIW